MGSINISKVIIGGLVAGLILNVVDFALFSSPLGDAMKSQAATLNDIFPALLTSKRAVVGNVAVDFLLGIVAVWLYAGIRPRFGPGARTAMIAGAAVWFVGTLSYSSFYLDRMMTLDLFCTFAVLELVNFIIASLAGGKLYSE